VTQIGVIGSPQFTLGFRLAGIRRIWDAESEEQLERAIAEARRDAEVSILVLETRDMQRISARTRHELVASVKPTAVAVGMEEDNTLREKIKQAVGVDLW
jgi:V/A-type H+-transporting ATPase subunit F